MLKEMQGDDDMLSQLLFMMQLWAELARFAIKRMTEERYASF